MKAFLASVVVALVIAVGAAYLLDGEFQQNSYTAFTTEGARISGPGDNLVTY
ncbi:MAG: hypothetical protein AAFX39_10070 [Pseudomonadota bacterium]